MDNSTFLFSNESKAQDGASTSDEKSNESTSGKGCGFIAMIFFCCLLGTGLFFLLAGKYFGETMRGGIFYGIMMLVVAFLVGREFLVKKK